MMMSLAGRTLGKYEIVEQIGAGGMATVYKGYQADVDRYVAIKVLPPHPGQDEQFITRFRLEARTIARLQHPNILPLYDYGNQDDILFLVMPYIQGGSLADRIKRGALPLDEADHVVRQVASALDYAHSQGVIHRDVKPDNILYMTAGNVMLADFGIVKMVGGTGATGALTTTGGLVGTPAYIAPEQLQGLPIGPGVDIYSLGVVTYQMLSGELPYTADTPMQLMLKHMSAPVPSITGVVAGLGPEIDLVMQRVLVKEPEARYSTATAFANAFSEAVRARSPEPIRPARLTQTEAATPERSRTAPSLPPTDIMHATPPPATSTEIAPSTSNRLSRGLWIAGTALLGLLIVVIIVLAAALARAPEGSAPTDAAATRGAEPSATTVAVLPAATPEPDFGSLSYGTTSLSGDTVNLRVQGLAPPGASEFYAVWLQRTDDQALLPLGRLSLDALGAGVLAYSDDEGRMLPTLYNSVLITRETTPGDAPTGEVAYSGYVPVELTDALYQILVESDAGREGDSLLDGALAEANIAAQHAGLASGSTNIDGRHVHAEHTVNILLGTRDDLNGDGRPENPGLGFGVPRFLDLIDNDLTTAAQTAAPWPILQTNVESIRVCVSNVRNWMNRVVDLEHEILALQDFDGSTAPAEASTEVMEAMLNGVDLNGNGQIEPFEGECGLQQVADYGVLVGSMLIVEGPPPAAEAS